MTDIMFNEDKFKQLCREVQKEANGSQATVLLVCLLNKLYREIDISELDLPINSNFEEYYEVQILGLVEARMRPSFDVRQVIRKDLLGK